MRYRAKSDFVSNISDEERILIAKGDKVFVQQMGMAWEVFSFYSRKSIGRFNQQDLQEYFGPESEFQKTPREGRFKGRNFGGRIITLLLFVLPLISKAQVTPITWSFNAVRVDTNYFELHMTADLYRGWWIYGPNIQDQCPYSPLVTFERNPLMKPIGKVDVIDFFHFTSNEDQGAPLCPVPLYKVSVTFVQVFKMTLVRSGTVKGQITYQTLSRYVIEPPKTIDFSVNINIEGSEHRTKVITIYPRGVFRKTWWFIKHPLGPQYIKKEIVP